MNPDRSASHPLDVNCEAEPDTYSAALLQQLRREPDRVIIHDVADPLTAQDFIDRIAVCAAYLRGMQPQGDAPSRIGLALHDNIWTMAAHIACWFIGAAPFQIDHRQPPDELARLITANELSLVVTWQRRLLSVAPAVCLMDGPATLLANPALHAEGAQILQGAGPSANDIAQYQTSSGVSGPPKVYSMTQQALLGQARLAASDGRRGAWGSALSPLSVFFGGVRLIWWRNLLAGKPIHAMKLLFTTAQLDAALQNEAIEECTLPPHLIRLLVQHAEANPCQVPRYPHLRKLQSIGGPALADDKLSAQRILTPHYIMTYSSTETGVVTAISGEDLVQRPNSCGRPQEGLEVAILSEDDRVLGPNEIGRIQVSWFEEKDGETVRQVGWPGDLGWLDEDGFLFIAGRGEDIICRNGVNYWLGLVEARLLKTKGIADVAVLRLPRAAGDDDTILAALLVKDAAATDDRLRAIGRDLRSRLASHEQPQAIVLVGDDFVTSSGKIRRGALVRTYLETPTSLTRI